MSHRYFEKFSNSELVDDPSDSDDCKMIYNKTEDEILSPVNKKLTKTLVKEGLEILKVISPSEPVSKRKNQDKNKDFNDGWHGPGHGRMRGSGGDFRQSGRGRGQSHWPRNSKRKSFPNDQSATKKPTLMKSKSTPKLSNAVKFIPMESFVTPSCSHENSDANNISEEPQNSKRKSFENDRWKPKLMKSSPTSKMSKAAEFGPVESFATPSCSHENSDANNIGEEEFDYGSGYGHGHGRMRGHKTDSRQKGHGRGRSHWGQNFSNRDPPGELPDTNDDCFECEEEEPPVKKKKFDPQPGPSNANKNPAPKRKAPVQKNSSPKKKVQKNPKPKKNSEAPKKTAKAKLKASKAQTILTLSQNMSERIIAVEDHLKETQEDNMQINDEFTNIELHEATNIKKELNNSMCVPNCEDEYSVFAKSVEYELRKIKNKFELQSTKFKINKILYRATTQTPE